MKALKALLKASLKSARFEHSRGVAETAVKMARKHRLSIQRAELAGWLHDCGKALDREQMQALLKKAGADAEEIGLPPLWHAPVGAWLARHQYHCKDADILKAIRFHTTGNPGATPLQKLVFVADYVEPNRPDWPELKALRPLALKDLDLAYREVLKHKMIDLLSHDRPLHTRSVAAWRDTF